MGMTPRLKDIQEKQLETEVLLTNVLNQQEQLYKSIKTINETLEPINMDNIQTQSAKVEQQLSKLKSTVTKQGKQMSKLQARQKEQTKLLIEQNNNSSTIEPLENLEPTSLLRLIQNLDIDLVKLAHVFTFLNELYKEEEQKPFAFLDQYNLDFNKISQTLLFIHSFNSGHEED